MSEDGRLLSLLAVFAPARAPQLLRGLGGDARRARDEGARLAAGPRAARLHALDRALQADAPWRSVGTERLGTIARSERERVREAVLALDATAAGHGRPAAARPAFRRLVEERLRGTDG
jgi:hypothetical protein